MMNNTSITILVLLLISFIPFDFFLLNADERTEIEFNRVENEGYSAFIVQGTNPLDIPEPPDPQPVQKCECGGSQVMVHGDGHKTPCQCFYEGDGTCNCSKNTPLPQNDSESNECRCYNSSECICDDGKCECVNCGCEKGVSDGVIVTEAGLMRDLDKLLGIKDSKVELVIFSAKWCLPCQIFKKNELPKLKQKFSNYELVDVDKEKTKWAENVKLTKNRSIPQFVIFEDGVFKEFWTGGCTADFVMNKIKAYQE